jgi:hypothetical protein
MTHPLRTHYDLLLLALAVLALGGSLTWVRRQQTVLREIRAEATVPVLVGARFSLPVGEVPRYSTSLWPAPGAQSRGGGWLYELFAPPPVFYDPATRDFGLSPGDRSPGTFGDAEFPVTLLAVTREPFRVQLAGYFGPPGDYRVALVSPLLPDTLLVRVGDRLDNLGLSLKRFEVSRLSVGQSEGAPLYEAVAIATLQDEWKGGEVVLDSRAIRFTDSLLALIRHHGSNEHPREYREGDNFTASGTQCRIERIQLEPAEVVVSRTRPGLPGPELQVLQPEDHEASGVSRFPLQAQTVPQHAALHGQ